MFEQFYQFERTPFSRDIAVEDLYEMPGQTEVLSRLKYAAKMRWFAVLTGECGKREVDHPAFPLGKPGRTWVQVSVHSRLLPDSTTLL